VRYGLNNIQRSPETSSASQTTGLAQSQQYSFLYAEMPILLNP